MVLRNLPSKDFQFKRAIIIIIVVIIIIIIIKFNSGLYNKSWWVLCYWNSLDFFVCIE